MKNLENKIVSIYDLSNGVESIELASLSENNVIIAFNPRVMHYSKDEVVRELKESLGDFTDEVIMFEYSNEFDRLPEDVDVANEDYFEKYGDGIREHIKNVLLPEVRKYNPKKIRIISKDDSFKNIEDISYIEIM